MSGSESVLSFVSTIIHDIILYITTVPYPVQECAISQGPSLPQNSQNEGKACLHGVTSDPLMVLLLVKDSINHYSSAIVVRCWHF